MRFNLPPIAILAISIMAGTTGASAHEDYTEWKRPDFGNSCCSDKDCYQTQAKFVKSTWYALRREDKKWIPVPHHLILKDQVSPDGKAHVCAPPHHDDGTFDQPEDMEFVFCFVPPNSGS